MDFIVDNYKLGFLLYEINLLLLLYNTNRTDAIATNNENREDMCKYWLLS